MQNLSKLLNTLIGEFNILYIPLVIFILFDYISIICVAVKKHKITKKLKITTFFRKLLIFLVAGLAHVIDCFLLVTDVPIESMVLLFYISNEGIIILKNLTDLGVPFPQKIKQIFEDLSQDDPQSKT